MEMCQAVPRDTVRLVQLLFTLPVPVTSQGVLCRKVWGVFLEIWSCEHIPCLHPPNSPLTKRPRSYVRG